LLFYENLEAEPQTIAFDLACTGVVGAIFAAALRFEDTPRRCDEHVFRSSRVTMDLPDANFGMILSDK
jgi:hypothetical protein